MCAQWSMRYACMCIIVQAMVKQYSCEKSMLSHGASSIQSCNILTKSFELESSTLSSIIHHYILACNPLRLLSPHVICDGFSSVGIYMDTINIFIRIATMLAGGGNRKRWREDETLQLSRTLSNGEETVYTDSTAGQLSVEDNLSMVNAVNCIISDYLIV